MATAVNPLTNREWRVQGLAFLTMVKICIMAMRKTKGDRVGWIIYYFLVPRIELRPSHCTTAFFCIIYFEVLVKSLSCPGQTGICDPSASASQEAGTTDYTTVPSIFKVLLRNCSIVFHCNFTFLYFQKQGRGFQFHHILAKTFLLFSINHKECEVEFNYSSDLCFSDDW